MAIVYAVLQIVAPVFLLAAIGYIWVLFGEEYRVAFVTRLAMTLSVPCLIFTSLMKTEIAPEALSVVVLASVASYAVLTILAWGIVKGLGLSSRTYWAPIIFGNTGNLGLPLAVFAFGETGLGYAVVIFAVMAVYSFTIGIWMVSGKGAASRILKEPMIWGTLLGALFLVKGWSTPVWLTNSLDLVGQMAIPLMLITLGVAVARLKLSQFGLPFLIAILKFSTAVLVGWAMARLFELPPIPFAVLVLQISTPVAVTSYLIAEKFGADAENVASLVVFSTLLSVATIPLTLVFLI